MTLTRKFRALAAIAVMGAMVACSSDDAREPPRDQNNLCGIFAERPSWRDATEQAERRWGAPVPIQMAIMWRESSFRRDARPPKKYILGLIPNGRLSSAFGYSQAIDGTWDWYRRESGNSGADRDDFEDSADFVGWYMAKSAQSNGIQTHDAYNHYLAYHEGHRGHRRGSYRAKAWLQQAARQVARQAERYQIQLATCS